MIERAKRAIEALRKPDASLARVVNTVRQSIAEVIEHQQILIDVQADRIEALKAALRRIAERGDGYTTGDGHAYCQEIARNALTPEQDKPSGFANLRAIMADQPYRNSGLSVHEIEVILANKGGFMPDEATAWFREARGKLGIAPEQDK